MENIPLYCSICEEIKQQINSGTYAENAYLPAERVLCEMYHVSRSTIRRALNELQKSGYIICAQGNGNFVKPRTFSQSLTKQHSFSKTLSEQGIALENKVLEYTVINSDKYLSSLPHTLNNASMESHWHKLVRLRYGDSYPLMIETSYMLQSRFITLSDTVLSGGSLYSYLESCYGLHVSRIDETLSPLFPTVIERTYLQIPLHVPCMLTERLCYEQEHLIMIHRTIIRGDKFKFKVPHYDIV